MQSLSTREGCVLVVSLLIARLPVAKNMCHHDDSSSRWLGFTEVRHGSWYSSNLQKCVEYAVQVGKTYTRQDILLLVVD